MTDNRLDRGPMAGVKIHTCNSEQRSRYALSPGAKSQLGSQTAEPATGTETAETAETSTGTTTTEATGAAGIPLGLARQVTNMPDCKTRR